jgi:hypothetical protein
MVNSFWPWRGKSQRVSLALQGETFRLKISQGALYFFAALGASPIASGRELLGMPHEREAIARVVTSPCLPRPRPVEQGDWPVAVLLQHPLHGRHADPRPLRDRRIAEKAVALP